VSLFAADPALAPYLSLVLLGFLPSEIWRIIAVFAARKIDEESELFQFVRCVATVLLVGVVVKIVLLPTQELAIVPVWARCAAIGVAAAAFFASRRSVITAILGGEAIIVLAAWRFGG
jgi:hypothetical protein